VDQIQAWLNSGRRFVIETLVSPTASQSRHSAAIAALEKKVSQLRGAHPGWGWWPEYRPDLGTYRVHAMPPEQAQGYCNQIVAQWASQIIASTLNGIFASR